MFNKMLRFLFLVVQFAFVTATMSQSYSPLIWAKGFGNDAKTSGLVYSEMIAKDRYGNTYLTGYFRGTVDFNPGLGNTYKTSVGNWDAFLAKYDVLGNLAWVNIMGGALYDQGTCLAIDEIGNVVVGGFFGGTADFDPGPGNFFLTAADGVDWNDAFLAKYDYSGKLLWAKSMGGTLSDAVESIALDGSGNVMATGYFQGTADFDPGPDTANLISIGSNDIFLAKYDATGSLVWANAIGGTSSDVGRSIAMDGSGNVVVTGYFQGSADFYPGTGIVNLTSTGNRDVFLVKYSAAGSLLWANSMGGTSLDDGYSLGLDGRGNIFVTGHFQGTADFDPDSGLTNLTSKGNTDIFLAKYSDSGDMIWAKSVGGTSADFVNSIAVDGSGNIFMTGHFQGTADFDPDYGFTNITSNGSIDIFLAKYTDSGNLVWANAIGGTSNDQGKSVAVDGRGIVGITGFFQVEADFDPGSDSAKLTIPPAKPNSRNTFIGSYAANTGEYITAVQLGGLEGNPTTVHPNSIVQDVSGNKYVIGHFGGTIDFDPGLGTAYLTSVGNDDIFFVKYDSLGNLLWAKSLGGASQDAGRSISLDLNGYIVLTGSFEGTVDFDPGQGTVNLTSKGSKDIFLAKYNTSGDLVWATSIGGVSDQEGTSLVVDGSGNVVVTGYFYGTVDFDPGSGTANLTSAGYSDIFLAKFNPLGSFVWAKAIGGKSYAQGRSVAMDGSGNVVVTGNFQGTADFDPGPGIKNLTSAGGIDFYLAKYDTFGGLVWAKAIGGKSSDDGYCLALDGYGNVIVTGIFVGTVDFDPGPETNNITSNGQQDIFLAKYDDSGGLVWANAIGGTSSSDAGNSLALDVGGNIVMTGSFAGTVDFDPGPETYNITSNGQQDIFLAKYDASGGFVWANAMGGSSSDAGNSLALDGSANVALTGYFNYIADFDPSVSTTELTSLSDEQYGFIAVYGSGLTCITPASGGTIASAQSGTSTFDPVVFTNIVSASGHSGTLEYKWQSSTTSSSEGFNDISGATSATYDASSLTQTTWYKRLARVSCLRDWTGAAESNVLEVTVTPVKTWLGGTGNWNVAANWSGGTLPLTTDVINVSTGNPKLNTDFTIAGSLTLSGTGSLTVVPGRTLTVSGAADFGGKPVTFRSDATGTAQLGTLTGTLTGAGNVTVERFIPATGRRWRLLTAPLTGITINSAWQNGQRWNGTTALTSDGTGTLITGQQPGSASNANAKGFDFWNGVSNSSASIMTFTQRPGQGIWTALANTTTAKAFDNGQSYLLFVRGPRGSGFSTGTANAATTLRPTGTLRQGDVNMPVDGSKGYTVVGNPYASQIDFNSLYMNSGNSSVIKRQFWMWDATAGTSGNWQAVVYSVDRYVEVPRKFHTAGQATPLTAIQSGHGFMVMPSTPSGGTMKIRESNKVATAAASPNILLSEGRTLRVFVNLMKQGDMGDRLLTDGVMIAYGQGYHMEATDAEDALKLDNSEENLAVSQGDAMVSADARPLTDMGGPIDLRLWNLRAGVYGFEVKTENMETGGWKAYLEDRVRDTRTPLPLNGEVGSVEFMVGADASSRSENRFRIVFEKAAVNASMMQEPGNGNGRTLSVYPNPVTGRTLTVRLRQVPKGIYSLQLLGSDGRLVTDRRIEHDGGSGSYRMELGGMLPRGIYQVRCQSGERSIGSEKLVVH